MGDFKSLELENFKILKLILDILKLQMKGKIKKVLSVLNGSFLSSLVEEENTLFDFLKGHFEKKNWENLI